MGYYEDGFAEAQEQLKKDLAKLGDVHPNYLADRQEMIGREALFNASMKAQKTGESAVSDSYTDQWRQEMDNNIRKRFAASGTPIDESIMYTNQDGSFKSGGSGRSGGSDGSDGSGGSLVKSGGNGMLQDGMLQAGTGVIRGAAGAARNFLKNAARVGVPAALGLGAFATGVGAANALRGEDDKKSEYDHYDDEFELTPYQQQLQELNAQAREDADLQGDVFERSSRLQRELGKDTLEQKMYKELATQGQLNKAQEAQNVLNNATNRMQNIGSIIQAASGNTWY